MEIIKTNYRMTYALFVVSFFFAALLLVTTLGIYASFLFVDWRGYSTTLFIVSLFTFPIGSLLLLFSSSCEMAMEDMRKEIEEDRRR